MITYLEKGTEVKIKGTNIVGRVRGFNRSLSLLAGITYYEIELSNEEVVVMSSQYTIPTKTENVYYRLFILFDN